MSDGMTTRITSTEVVWRETTLRHLRHRGRRALDDVIQHRAKGDVVLLGLLEKLTVRGEQKRLIQTEETVSDS